MKGVELIAKCREHEGETEARRNSSPKIDGWLRFVGQPPGVSWCAAYTCSMIHETDPSVEFHKTASAMKFLELNAHLRVTLQEARPGDVVIWDHGNGKGHIAVMTGTTKFNDQLTEFAAIAGNTSKDGKSREGTMVKEHDGFDATDSRIAGVVRVCSEE